MALVYVTVKVMPAGLEVNLEELKSVISSKIKEKGNLARVEEKPVAFGLKALEAVFTIPEEEGGTDELEEELRSVEGVQSVTVVDVRRAIG